MIRLRCSLISVAVVLSAATALAQGVPADLDRDLQNPLARLYLLPLQYNGHQNVGPFNRTRSVFNIQPVVPTVGEKRTYINRFVVPIVSEPDAIENKSTFGLGDILYQGYFVPPITDRNILGIGPAFLLPSGSAEELSTKKWSIGPTVAWVNQPGNWTFGGLFTQLWSIAGDSDRDDVNQLQILPLIYYRLGGGTSLGFLHTITANWEESAEDQWTVPVGMSISQIVVHPWFYPFEIQMGAYGNVIRPEDSSDWLLKMQINFVLPR
ncbi:hypothetical protein D3C87_1368890 [compost metagenome]